MRDLLWWAFIVKPVIGSSAEVEQVSQEAAAPAPARVLAVAAVLPAATVLVVAPVLAATVAGIGVTGIGIPVVRRGPWSRRLAVMNVLGLDEPLQLAPVEEDPPALGALVGW